MRSGNAPGFEPLNRSRRGEKAEALRVNCVGLFTSAATKRGRPASFQSLLIPSLNEPCIGYPGLLLPDASVEYGWGPAFDVRWQASWASDAAQTLNSHAAGSLDPRDS